MKGYLSSALLAGLMAIASPALAQSEPQISLELDSEMGAFENKELSQGPVKGVWYPGVTQLHDFEV